MLLDRWHIPWSLPFINDKIKDDFVILKRTGAKRYYCYLMVNSKKMVWYLDLIFEI